jgi:energy-converting hydrogenase B subunit D
MKAYIIVLLLLTATAGTGVALSRSPRRQVFAMSANGVVLALLFMGLQAPDAAFAEIVVGAAALPLLFLVVLASSRMGRAPSRQTPIDSSSGES